MGVDAEEHKQEPLVDDDKGQERNRSIDMFRRNRIPRMYHPLPA